MCTFECGRPFGQQECVGTNQNESETDVARLESNESNLSEERFVESSSLFVAKQTPKAVELVE